ncbi:MAG: acyl carrier protein, partial [Gemmatimonadota bacterium]
GGGMALDSIASLEIVASLEAEFGFQIPDEDLRPELFDSVATLTEYVEGRLSAATEAEGR